MALLFAFLIVLAVLVGSHFLRKANLISTTRKGATEFLSHTAEWTKWMAGIQTAALGVLAVAVLDRDYLYGRDLDCTQQTLAVFAFVFLGCALLASAWVLSSIPSQSIRLHAVPANEEDLNPAFDIYEQPLYGWLNKTKSEHPDCLGKCNKLVFTFAYLLTVKHTLWVLGLFSVGALAITIYLTPPQAKVADSTTPSSCWCMNKK